MKEQKTVFVTVGTTKFDELIKGTTSDVALEWMVSQGYTHLIVQYGSGREPMIPKQYKSKSTTKEKHCTSPNNPRGISDGGSVAYLSITTYRFRPSLHNDMERSDLIISHAGAGTVMEVLRFPKTKKMIVVINTNLMDNHQTELATAMSQRGHLFVVSSPEQLISDAIIPGTTATDDDGTCKKYPTSIWRSFENFLPVPHYGGNEHDVPNLLDSFLGFDTADARSTKFD